MKRKQEIKFEEMLIMLETALEKITKDIEKLEKTMLVINPNNY